MISAKSVYPLSSTMLKLLKTSASFSGSFWCDLLPVVSQFFDLTQNALIIFICSFVIVSSLCAFVLWDWRLIIAHIVSSILIMVDSLGLISLMGIQMNAISVLSVVTSLGLSSEYTVH